MSSQRIAKLIESLKDRSYQPNPARRTYIAKKNDPAKKRPLGIPASGDDKLVQEVIRMILESNPTPAQFFRCFTRFQAQEKLPHSADKDPNDLYRRKVSLSREISRRALTVSTTMC